MTFDALNAVTTARHPIIWVTTGEQYRIMQHLAKSSKRKVYTLSATSGLNLWDNDRWIHVMYDNYPEMDENGQPIIPPAIKGLPDALEYITKHDGLFIVPQAHLYVEKILEYLASSHDDWLDAFYADDVDSMTVSMILLSHKDEVPGEIANVVSKVVTALPELDELLAIVDHTLNHSNDKTTNDETKLKIARAGQGLTAPGFINSLTQSLVLNNKIDPEYINSAKIKIIGGDGILKIRTPRVTMDEVGGMDYAKSILSMSAKMWASPDQTNLLGVKPLTRIVLCGVSGTGKSRLCEAAASGIGLDLAEFSVSQAMSKFVGESESNMRHVFDQIKALRPIMLWTDELGRDLSGGASSSMTDGGTTSRVHGAFLQGMQELPDDVFWIAAANDLSDLPPEMLRSGRIDKLLFVGFPTLEERRDIFKIHLHEDSDLYDIDQLATRTPLFTGAEIESLIKHVRFHVAGQDMRKPMTQDIVEYIPQLKNRQWRLHKATIVTLYEKALKEWDWASTSQYNEAHMVIDAAKNQPKNRTAIPDAAMSA